MEQKKLLEVFDNIAYIYTYKYLFICLEEKIPMPHTHYHSHARISTASHENERKVFLSFLLITSFMIIEVIGGMLSGSLALIADAGHMLTDATALALSFIAFRLGRRPADSNHTFGHTRFEVLASFMNALAMCAIALWIIYEAWIRFNQPSPILAGPMMIVAIMGLIVNIIVFRILSRGSHEHISIKAASVNVLGDLLGSVAAILAATIIYFTGWLLIDPILSVLVSLLIIRCAWGILTQSAHILLEGAPENAEPHQIRTYLLKAIPELSNVDHIHVWTITSGHVIATLHIHLKDDNNAKDVVKKVKQELHSHFNIENTTVAVDWNEEQPSYNPSSYAHSH